MRDHYDFSKLKARRKCRAPEGAVVEMGADRSPNIALHLAARCAVCGLA